jgi:L-asparaginase II
MTKFQSKQVEMIKVYMANNMSDTAARSLSSLICSAMRSKDQQELINLAQSLNLSNNPEFII